MAVQCALRDWIMAVEEAALEAAKLTDCSSLAGCTMLISGTKEMVAKSLGFLSDTLALSSIWNYGANLTQNIEDLICLAQGLRIKLIQENSKSRKSEQLY